VSEVKKGARWFPHFTLAFIVVTSYSCLYTPEKWKPIYSVEFHGGTGWMWGAISYKSSDNGGNWRRLSLPHRTGRYDTAPVGHPFAIVDEKLGFCAPGGYLKMTTDGGATWRDLHRDRKFLAFPFFMLNQHWGFARDDEQGGMLGTEDGGRSWQKIEEFGYADITHLVLSDGILYGLMSDGLYQSTDRGLSWIKLVSFDTHVEAMSLIGDCLWFVGWDGLCAAYYLKEHTLQHFPLPVEDGPLSIAGNRGMLVAVGYKGGLFVSKVTPPLWKKVDIGITDNLRDVAFAADGTAFVVGGDYDDLFTGWANRVALKSRDCSHWEEVELP